MNLITKALSLLSLHQQGQLPQLVDQSIPPIAVALPEEVLLRIFSHLHHGSFLTSAILTCKKWSRVARDPSLWQDIAIRAHPHEARQFFLLAKLHGAQPDWHRIALRQNHTIHRLLANTHKVVESALPTDYLAHAPFAKRTWVDIDGQLFVADPKKLRFSELHSTNKKECHSLENLVDKSFAKATMALCSIRHTENGKVALIKLEHDGRSQLIAYNVQKRCLIWQGAPNEAPVFPGSLNLGVGWVRPPEVPRWNEKIVQERQELSIEPLSSTFFTASQGTETTTIGIYDLTSQNPLRTTLQFPKNEPVKHIDSDQKATLLVIARQMANQEIQHTLAGLRSNGTYLKFSSLQVLAFDPYLSLAVIRSTKERHRLKPIFLAQYSSEDGAHPVRFYKLPIPPRTRYKAQFKGNYLAILGEGQASNDLYFMNLFQQNRDLVTKVLIEHIHNYTIRSFTLLEDSMLIYTSVGFNEPGPVVLYDLKSCSMYLCCSERIKRVIGREGHLLICQTANALVTLNVKNGTIKKLRSEKNPASYLSGILSQEKHKPLCYHEYY